MSFFVRSQSAAIKIVDPSTQDEKPPTRKDARAKQQCRNVVIHGYCKYQDTCPFAHPSPEPSAPTSPSQPTTSGIPSQAVNANAPVFVPRAVAGVATPPPPSAATPETEYSDYDNDAPQEQYQSYAYAGGEEGDAGLMEQMADLDVGFYDDSQYPAYTDYDPHMLDVGYYPSPPVYLRQPLDYHLYTPIPSAKFLPSTSDTHLVPPSHALRQLLQKRSETIRQIAPAGSNLPEELQGYHTLVPLEPTTGDRRKLGNWYSTVYRAINATDGLPYALRRIESEPSSPPMKRSPPGRSTTIVRALSLSLRNAFRGVHGDDQLTRAPHPALVFVHAYHADAETLFDVHLKPKPPSMQTHSHSHSYQHGHGHGHGHGGRSSLLQAHLPRIIPERTIWSYIVQIASAIKKVHEVGQAVRNIDVTKILLTGQNRQVLSPSLPFPSPQRSCCGIIDVLMHDAPQDIVMLQQEDLNMFGRLIFALCCNNITATSGQNIQKSVDFIGRSYSTELKEVAMWFTSRLAPIRTINMFLDKINARVVAEMEEALDGTDRLETELLSELENARLVRLLCKFGFINERPEFAREPRWSETGDRYIIKLFRDYVFHQVDERGNPVVNLSHVLTCLNKLDAGTDEKIMLVARDEQSCLIVSYKEIKHCVESAFSDLARAATAKR
ncbi:hypothetical protein C0992_008190 [Termitomyces sp. T32_za158]|nr:hypothetical protein C0992_008190 [Termitomyces sp. T32_za158]